MPEPLSALLITRVWSSDRSLTAFCWAGVRLGLVLIGCKVFVSVLTLFRYSSVSGEAIGGVQVLFFLKGCGSVGGLFLKKYFILMFLSKTFRDSSSGI